MAEKHVQTSLPETLYEPLRRKARREGRSLKELVREAVTSYLRREEDLDHDPLDDFVGSGTLPEGNWSTRKDWRDPYRKHRRNHPER